MAKIERKILHYPAVFNPTEGKGFDVSFPDFPGCVTFGKDLAEAKEKAHEVLEIWLEELQSNGEKIPVRQTQPIIDDIQVSLSTT